MTRFSAWVESKGKSPEEKTFPKKDLEEAAMNSDEHLSRESLYAGAREAHRRSRRKNVCSRITVSKSTVARAQVLQLYNSVKMNLLNDPDELTS